MIVDKMDAFEALEQYAVRIARTKYVDSAEDAIAFAERRNARDPREVPIVLRVPGAGVVQPQELENEPHLDTEEAIRRAYAAIAGKLGVDGKIVAQAATEPGTDVVISGETDEALGKTIVLHSATHAVRRMIPLDDDGAAMLAANFEGFHHHGSREQIRRMLEHLLVKISHFFGASPVTALTLVVRLHENSYTVLDIEMTSPQHLHIKPRLDPRAHDRKGDDFHPSGRQ